MKGDNILTFRTVCAWCGKLISEQECPETDHYQALSNNGIIISHGICKTCKKSVEMQYGLNHKEGKTG